jgi:hypothetical protein
VTNDWVTNRKRGGRKEPATNVSVQFGTEIVKESLGHAICPNGADAIDGFSKEIVEGRTSD